VEVGPGDAVTGASVNTYGLLTVRATRVGADTRLAQIGRLVARAQTGKAPVQRLADRISAVFVPAVVLACLATFAAWLATGRGPQAAFTAAVAVLIIACPCALGLATPTALLVGSGRGAQLGILIKGPEILESTRRVTTILLDKTGTLTDGQMRLRSIFAPDDDSQSVLRVAGALESGSEHPLAAPICAAARERGPLGEVEAFAAVPGAGVAGTVTPLGSSPGSPPGRSLAAAAGRPDWLAGLGFDVPAALASNYAAARGAGASPVMVAWDGRARGVLVLKDAPKATSAQAVAQIKALGIRPRMLTGDAAGAAREVAQAVGIAQADVIAQVLPEGKAALVERLQGEGEVVAMAGDGVNDAAALAQADLGLAMGSGTDVAIEASDITLVRGDLRALPQAIRLSRRTLRVVKQNLFWAFAYNVAALPLAALGLLNPMIAGAAMAASSVIVVANSLRLRGFESPRRPA
jgi:Cu+-exporting ATPase